MALDVNTLSSVLSADMAEVVMNLLGAAEYGILAVISADGHLFVRPAGYFGQPV